MGFLRRLLGGRHPASWPPPGPIRSWPPDPLNTQLNAPGYLFQPVRGARVDAVGEGAHQGTLERMAGGRTIDGPMNRDHTALLLPEPTNFYDVNAVRVVLIPSTPGVPAATVGHLSREDALAYRPVIDRVAAAGKLTVCKASMTGGWDRGPDDRGSIGVILHLGTVADCEAELAKEPPED
jgi:hypothetical protein